MVQSLSAPVKIDDGEIDLNAWLHYLAFDKRIQPMDQVRQAAMLAQLTGEHVRTPLSMTCLHQGLVMAEILADLNSDRVTLCAGIIAPCVLYADLSIDDVGEHLGPSVKKLIQGMIELQAFEDLQVAITHPRHHPKVDNLRKMFLAMIRDIRVVLLKLAERVYMMHNLSVLPASDCKRIAKETEAIYAPLANRLGVGDVKWQLEDLSFRYIHPKVYRTISKGLNQKRLERESFVWDFMSRLRELLEAQQVEVCDLMGRVKHIFSIYKKMRRKDVSIDQVYDTTAVRILVNTVDDCYRVLSAVHHEWSHVPEEFDDYIATPKSNGYRSIHTAVVVNEGRHIEVQIRTVKMHQQAELGAAAHWLYKESHTKRNDMVVDKIAWLRQMLAWQRDMSSDNQRLCDTYEKVFSDRVYVFTPKDEVLDLVQGATVLDFAYLVHTEIGHRCAGAKVNDKIVPLNKVLCTGDRVEILTRKTAQPSRDWMNPHGGFLFTARAKAKVHHWFRSQSREENIRYGKEMLENEWRRMGFVSEDLPKVLPLMHCQQMSDLYALVGCGDIRLPSVLSAWQSKLSSEKPTCAEVTRRAGAQVEVNNPPILVEGVSGVKARLAVCCQPVPGDAIVGYITQGRGVSVHRSNCRNIHYFRRRYPQKMIMVSWQQRVDVGYPVDVLLTLSDNKPESLNQVERMIAKQKVRCLAIRPAPESAGGTRWIMTVSVVSLDRLSALLVRCAQLASVVDMVRMY